MTCPVCGGATKMPRTLGECDAVYRVRKCVECNYTFYTTELEQKDSEREYKRVNHEKYYKRSKKL